MYDYMFEWLKTATKEQRHCDEMEDFSRKHPVIFMKFHMISKHIVHDDINSEEYKKAKEEITELIIKNEDKFKPVLEAIKKMATK